MDNAPPEPTAQSKPPVPAITGEIPQGIELINYVAECLALGCDPEDIRKQLLAFGHTPANAEKLVADTIAWRERSPIAGKSAQRTESSNSGTGNSPTVAKKTNPAQMILLGVVLFVGGWAVAYSIQPGCFSAMLGVAALFGLLLIGLGIAGAARR